MAGIVSWFWCIPLNGGEIPLSCFHYSCSLRAHRAVASRRLAAQAETDIQIARIAHLRYSCWFSSRCTRVDLYVAKATIGLSLWPPRFMIIELADAGVAN
ncbi:hypothetical protein GQ54DRAFT_299651 [Martensiomyces pterosporus]|nr:hypothetical protein GQ54DRAFT_299651 [Martensiomyces pterosporus]